MMVTRSAIQSLHASLRARPAAANYVLCILGSFYSRIIRDWELADIRNPVSNTKRFASHRVERFLSPEERRSLETVLQQGVRMRVATRGYIEPMSAWALQLLAHTGLRKDEIITLMAVLREIQEHTGQPSSGYVIRSRTGRRRLLSPNPRGRSRRGRRNGYEAGEERDQ